MIDFTIRAQAVEMLREEISRGGEMRFTGPTGSNKSRIVVEAVREHGGRILSISRYRELSAQFAQLCCDLGVDWIEHHRMVGPRGTAGQHCAGYSLIIVQEDMRHEAIDHPNVLRIV